MALTSKYHLELTLTLTLTLTLFTYIIIIFFVINIYYDSLWKHLVRKHQSDHEDRSVKRFQYEF